MYDPVPFIQGLGADNFGYMIFLGEDTQRVASIGLTTRTADFHPNIPFGSQPHSMVSASHGIHGYLNRLQILHKNSKAGIPIQTNGFENGAVCNEAMECQSGKCRMEEKQDTNWNTCVPADCMFDDYCPSSDTCVGGQCLSKLSSCMICQNDGDCSSGKCLSNFCAGSSGLIDNNCNCKTDADCASHRCRFGVCEAKLPIGALCTSSDDCSSGVCGRLMKESNVTSIRPLCQTSGKLGLARFDFDSMNIPINTPIRMKMNWCSLLVVMLCCMILTFSVVKRFMYCRRKDYSTIPNVQHYT